MAEIKVPGGRVITRERHTCRKPDARPYGHGDVFECEECGARYKWHDAQEYQGGPGWVPS